MDNELLKEVLEAVMQLPAMKWCEEQQRMSAEADLTAEAEMNAPEMEKALMEEEGAVAGEEIAGEEEAVADEGAAVDEGGEAPVPAEEEEKAEFSEEAIDDEMSGGNDLGESKVKMQYDQEKRKYAKLESQYDNLQKKVFQLERAERISSRKADLMQLDAEGFSFSLAKELDKVKDLDKVMYSQHLSTIRECYKKAPIGVEIKNAIVPDEVVSKNKSHREVLEEATKRAAEKYKK